MKRKDRSTPRLRDMNPERALAYCANLTKHEWSRMDDDFVLDLWAVFKSYILNGYKEDDRPVPARVAYVWSRCKSLIDKEVAK